MDVLFLFFVIVATAREVVAGRNWRNLPPIFIVLILLIGNVIFHVEDHELGATDLGTHLGIAAALRSHSVRSGRRASSACRRRHRALVGRVQHRAAP
jgi:uncharacterized protein involved in response to NO